MTQDRARTCESCRHLFNEKGLLWCDADPEAEVIEHVGIEIHRPDVFGCNLHEPRPEGGRGE